MKPSRGKERVGPEQDDLDRLGLAILRPACPPSHTMPTRRKAPI